MVHWMQCFVVPWIIVTQICKAAKICDVHGTRNTNLLYKFQGRAILNGVTCAEQRKINKDKSDISYLKTSPAFNVPIHSKALLAAILCWLASDSVASWVAARFWHFHSWPASRHHVYVASASQYPPRNRNYAGLLIVAAQSSRLL